MLPKKRCRDTTVVRTEPDRHRATGAEDENDFKTDDEEEEAWRLMWSTAGMTRYRREKARAQTPTKDTTFPFMGLPAEVRNMIYRCLVLSKCGGLIDLNTEKSFVRGGIETAILTTSRLVYTEAIKILYDENRCVAKYGWFQDGFSLRRDDGKTASKTSRTLRSGREVDMVKHRGLIYEKSVHLLRHLEFQVNIFDCKKLCDHLILYYARSMVRVLESAHYLISDCWCGELGRRVHGWDWVVRINFAGQIPLKILRVVLLPVLSRVIFYALEDGWFRFELHGPLQEEWPKLFRRFINDPGFNTDNVQATEIKARKVNNDDFKHSLGNIIENWKDRDQF